MSLWKKTKDLFNRMTGQAADASPPPYRPEPTPEPAEVQDPRFAYRREQRDYERRAKATSMFWASWSAQFGGQGTYRRTTEKPKRPGRARRTLLAITEAT